MNGVLINWCRRIERLIVSAQQKYLFRQWEADENLAPMIVLFYLYFYLTYFTMLYMQLLSISVSPFGGLPEFLQTQNIGPLLLWKLVFVEEYL